MTIPKRSSRTSRLAAELAVGLACALGWAAPAASQVAGVDPAPQEAQPQEAEAPADTTVSDGAPIPASEIARRAGSDVTELILIRALLGPDTDVSRIAQQFPPAAEERRRLVEESGVVLKSPTPRKLSEIKERWDAQNRLLKAWEETLAGRAEQLDREREQMRQIRDLWTRQQAFLDSAGGPPAVFERAASIVATTDTLGVRFDERFNAVLTLQDKIADGLIEAAEMETRIRAAHGVARRRLFVRESAPLWDIFAEREDSPSLAEQMRAALSDDLAQLGAYVEEHGEDLAKQAVFFLLLLAFMLWRSRASRRWPESVLHDESMAASLQVIRRPISSALLLSLWLTSTFQPRRPEVLGEIVELLAIVPVLRLIPARIFETLRAPIYGLVLLYLLVTTNQLTISGSPVHRLTLLTLTLLSLLGLFWVLRSGSQLDSMRSERGWGAVYWVACAGAAVLAVALLANVIGNVSLSDTLTLAVVTSGMYGILVYALVWVLRGLWRLLLRSGAGQKLNVIRIHRDRLDRGGSTLINAAGVLLWAWVTLRAARLWVPVVDWIRASLATSFTFGSVTIQVGGVLAFIAVLVVTMIVSRIIRVVLAEDVLSRTQLPRGLPGTISTVVHYAIITLGFLFAMAAAGIELNRVVVLAGALGVGIGFGLQDIVRNFVSGLILAFERPFGIGDVVEVGSLLGKVRRIGARSSTIRTYDGADVIVPNSNLVSNQVINWTLGDSSRRITISVGVAYGSDPDRVLEVLREVAVQHPEVSKYPEPMTLFRGFGDSALNFELRFWISDVERTLRTGSAITNGVHDALKAAGITIPFPQRDLHLRTVDAKGEILELGAAVADQGGDKLAAPKYTEPGPVPHTEVPVGERDQ